MRSIFKKSVISGVYATLLSAIALAAPINARADRLTADELERCSTIDEATSRLACYDKVSGRPAPSAATPAAMPAVTKVPGEAAAPAAKQTPAGNETTARLLSARVTKCDKNVSGQLEFYLDNGQVWQQSNHRRINLSDCDFSVTIKKEFLGHKMRLDDGSRNIRVKRIK